MNAPFYIVLCDDHDAPPARHDTHAQAEAHAELLCADSKSRAYVLKAVAVVEHHAISMTWTPLVPAVPTHDDAPPHANDAHRARLVLDEDKNGDGSLHDDLHEAIQHVSGTRSNPA